MNPLDGYNSASLWRRDQTLLVYIYVLSWQPNVGCAASPSMLVLSSPVSECMLY